MSSDFFAGVLKLVNDARKALGMPLLYDIPKGYMSNGSSCPLYNALDQHPNSSIMHVDSEAYFKDESDARAIYDAWWKDEYFEDNVEIIDDYMPGEQAYGVSLPGELRHFVFQFDNGYFPELVETS